MIKVLKNFFSIFSKEVFSAFHKEFEKVEKYSKLYHIGKLADENYSNLVTVSLKQKIDMEKLKKQSEIRNDFKELRKLVFEMGLSKPSNLFYILQGLHIVLLHITGYFILLNYGGRIIPTLCALICHVIAQAQADWTQHDYGHSSFFEKSKFNRYLHLFFMGFIKGASAEWWSHMHNQHHAKPNIVSL